MPVKTKKRKPALPPIPNIPDELFHPISALVRFSFIFHGVLVQIAEGKPFSEVAKERGEYLLMGEDVLNAWKEKLVIELE